MDLKKLFRFNLPLQLLKAIESKQASTRFVNDIFWGFNSFLVIILILNEIYDFFLVPVIHTLIKGYPFTTVTFYSLVLYLVPIVTIFIRGKLNEKPVNKIKFMFGIEIPILITVIIRQEMMWNLNMSLQYLFLLLLAMMLFYSIQFFFPRIESNGFFGFILRLRKLVLYSFIIFFSLMFLSSVVPLSVVFFIKVILHLDLIQDMHLIRNLIIIVLFIAFIILGLPPVFFAFKYCLKHFMNKVYGMNMKNKVIYLFSTLIIFSNLYVLNIKKPEFLYLNLKNEPSLLKQQEVFFNKMDQIEKELLQVASFRKYYLGSLQNNTFCWSMTGLLDLNIKQTKLLQSIYNVLMFPFFYQDTGKADYVMESDAYSLYEQLFDAPMLECNYFNDIGTPWHSVHIDRQEVVIKEYGDIAEIQICETYSTNSGVQQEIIIHFELPYNSVVTGLWISDDKYYDKKYPGVVAPSGAAQKVYINEVVKQVDPALLSQIGSNKYLLRAFPIMDEGSLALDSLIDDKYKNNYQFRVWYSYKTFISKNNTWVLPKLLYKWNVHWSDKTTTIINGNNYQRPDSWLPEYVVAQKAEKIKEHAATISDSVQIISKPIESCHIYKLNRNIAILIDGSYSMNKNRKRLFEYLHEIKGVFSNFKGIDCFIVGNDIKELKLSKLFEEIAANPQLFFGKTDYMTMLDSFTSRVSDYANKYKSIILISDITDYWYPEDGLLWSYDNEPKGFDTLRPRKLYCPVIVYNLSEEYHQIDPKNFFNQIVYTSNGGFAKNKEELITLLYINNQPDDNLIVSQDGIAYFKSKVFKPSDTLFSDFATKEFINHFRFDDSIKLIDLDVMNELAQKESIITKYSSMIALVNQEQVDSLASAQTQHDRYNNFREYESGNSAVFGLLNIYSGEPIPKYPESMVIFMFMFLLCIMIYADRFR